MFLSQRFSKYLEQSLHVSNLTESLIHKLNSAVNCVLGQLSIFDRDRRVSKTMNSEVQNIAIPQDKMKKKTLNNYVNQQKRLIRRKSNKIASRYRTFAKNSREMDTKQTKNNEERQRFAQYFDLGSCGWRFQSIFSTFI